MARDDDDPGGLEARSGTTLDPELLARFVDGTLDPETRRRVLETLAHSAADREVLADVVREMEGGPDGVDGPGPARRRPPRSYMLI